MTRLQHARTAVVAVGCAVCTMAMSDGATAQELEIGIIDFYGLGRVSATRAREALTFTEGDAVPLEDGDAFLRESEERLAQIPGVAQARVRLICCDDARGIVYVGIEEDGAQQTSFRAAPTGAARLAPDVVRAGEEFSQALLQAVQRGDAGEDWSQGHVLADDPARRAIQERFIIFSKRDLASLRQVLRTSADAEHRALAAVVLGYAPDKQAVVADLVRAMRDPADEVRNNAMRALLVFGAMRPSGDRPAVRVPLEPFFPFLVSPVWTDRNKAVLALWTLSASRDPELLATLRGQDLDPLGEMARWKSEGHAQPAFLILGRIAGYSEEAAVDLWQRGEREVLIDAVRNRQ